MEKNKIICIVAGKSGGHIIPGMTYARNYIKAHPEYDLLFFSTDSQLDRSIIALYPYILSYVPLKLMGIPGAKIWLYPLFIIQFLRAFFISVRQLRKHRPDHVVSMGGYVSLPVCLAARFLKIPVELFELNAVPGKAVVWLAPLARKIYVCFEEAGAYFKKYQVEFSEYPLRFGPEDRIVQSGALVQLGLDTSKKTLVILGGSQGSRAINEIMKSFFTAHAEVSSFVQVIHQTGTHGLEQLRDFYKKMGISALVYDYDHNLQYTYCAADVIIARAGAGTLFEIGFFEKPAIVVPLEISNTAHQVDNAYAMQCLNAKRAQYANRKPLFTVVRQHDMLVDPKRFYQEILSALA